VLADEPEALGLAVAHVLADPWCRKRFGEAACRGVQQQYGLSALRAAPRTTLENLADHPRASHPNFMAHGTPS
jgi:hypothetical protein